MEIKIDKSEWSKVRLGDVAFEYSKRVSNPSESGRDRFIGNSNIGQWDFRVKTWESTDSVTSAMKLFDPEDYLLVRRSLYASDFRERAPRAHFSGVCSGDILTIKENPEFISDGFLIGVLNSPALWKFVVANASGSITRRIKWKDLANYEFLLPPKTQQTELAKLLWSMDKVLEKDSMILRGLSDYQTVKSEKEILENVAEWKRLDEITSKKISYGIVQAGKHIEDGMPYIKSSDITKNGINFISLKKTSLEIAKKYRRSEVVTGDLVFSLRGNLGAMNIVPRELPVANLTQGTARISVSGDYLNIYVMYALETMKVQRRINALSKGSTFKEISLEALRTVKIPVPSSKEEQKKIADKITLIKESIRDIKNKSAASQSLKKYLINQVF